MGTVPGAWPSPCWNGTLTTAAAAGATTGELTSAVTGEEEIERVEMAVGGREARH